MAEHATPEVEEQPRRKKRSLLKLLLLALNVLLFLAGVGSLAWTKFGPKPVASAVAQGQDQHEDQKDTAPHEPAAKGHEVPAKASAAAKPSGGHGSSAGTKSAGQGGNAAPSLVPLAPFLVNLSGDQGQRYLRLVVQVEVRGELSKDELEKHLPEVRNRLIFLLSSKAFADIGSTQGKYDLQAEITKNINETLDGPFIKKTYFTEFIVQ
jgi:flagellar protein FliL